MCKNGLSCSHEGEQGRVENMYMKKSEVVGMFTGNSSRTPRLVTVNELNFLNKKAEKKAQTIIDNLPGKKSVA